MTTEQQRVADAVQKRMDELGFVQRSLAREAGVDTGTVNNLLTGKRWPRVRQRSAIEAALNWQLGTLVVIRDGGQPTRLDVAPGGADPHEEVIRQLPYLLDEDIEVFLKVYRTRRDEHTQARLLDLENMLRGLSQTVEDREVRRTIADQFRRQIADLRRAGYESVPTDTQPVDGPTDKATDTDS